MSDETTPAMERAAEVIRKHWDPDDSRGQAQAVLSAALDIEEMARVIEFRWMAHAADGTSMALEAFARDFAAAIRKAILGSD